jgi:hypothetical protein
VPGVNPIEFNNLEDYTEFLDWQQSQGIRCPVLYLQETYDTQGNLIYKSRPSVSDLQGGLPPNINIPVHGYDPENQNIGVPTPSLNNKQSCSDNAMDDNWCGGDSPNSDL